MVTTRVQERLCLISSQPSWVSVRNGSGEVIFEGTLSELETV